MATERTNPFTTETLGRSAKQSRQKAESAADRAGDEIRRGLDRPSDDNWPVSSSGIPFIKAEMTFAELIPTGDYANVSVGPARIYFLIDPTRQLGQGETYFSENERAVIAAALNEAAEITGADVIGVQRNLVLESLQQQVGAS